MQPTWSLGCVESPDDLRHPTNSRPDLKTPTSSLPFRNTCLECHDTYSVSPIRIHVKYTVRLEECSMQIASIMAQPSPVVPKDA